MLIMNTFKFWGEILKEKISIYAIILTVNLQLGERFSKT